MRITAVVHCPKTLMASAQTYCLIFSLVYSALGISPVEAFESSPSLRQFDFEVLLGSSSSRLVVTGNPLVNSAAMCNDARGSGKEPNAELFVALFVSLDGSRELHVMLQTTKQIKAGIEILVDYGEAFWRAWAGLRDAVSEARGQILADLLHEIGC